MRNICIVGECNKINFGQGYCNMHYKRVKKTGAPGPATTIKRTSCSVVGCPEKHAGLGFCNTHWTRFKTTGEIPTTPIRRYGEVKPPCARQFCTIPSDTKGLCVRHYGRFAVYKTYGVSFGWDDYDALWLKQNGLCGICKADLVWDSKLTHVDHDHMTSKVRGLLCSICNQGLGSFRDDRSLLKAAIKYLA
jgi:hypothetical protein